MSDDTPTLVIRQLRQLVPKRLLTASEARRVVELQANRFRELLVIDTPELPDAAITTLPRVRVVFEPRLPVSGATVWHNGRWLILINSLEDFSRQRFSMAHELFHVINYPTSEYLVPGADRFSKRAEQFAEYFGGCLLAPKRHLARLVGEGYGVSDLATTFGMSERAVRVRLEQLYLANRHPKCGVARGIRITAVNPLTGTCEEHSIAR